MTVVGGFRHGGVQGGRGMGEAVSEVKAVIRAAALSMEKEGKWEGGNNWNQLSEAEAEVFEIEADRFPLMIMTLHAYDIFAGAASGSWMEMENEAVFTALKAARPDLFGKGCGVEAFVNFADALGQIDRKEAWQIWQKQQAWDLRLGVLEF
jgi:hypothetical protein